MVAPPLCGTLLLPPFSSLFESWCSVELLPETGPAAEAAASQREEGRGKLSNAFSKLHLTEANQNNPFSLFLPLCAYSKPLSIHKFPLQGRQCRVLHHIPAVTGRGHCQGLMQESLLPPFPFAKGQIPPYHVPSLPKDAERNFTLVFSRVAPASVAIPDTPILGPY